MNVIVSILLWLWELPQNVLGLIFYANMVNGHGKKCDVEINVRGEWRKFRYIYKESFPGGITLGEYVVLGGGVSQEDIKHEYGHVRQSRMLGWLYLIVVGVPSLWHAFWHDKLWLRHKEYEHFWTERWADRLGGN